MPDFNPDKPRLVIGARRITRDSLESDNIKKFLNEEMLSQQSVNLPIAENKQLTAVQVNQLISEVSQGIKKAESSENILRLFEPIFENLREKRVLDFALDKIETPGNKALRDPVLLTRMVESLTEFNISDKNISKFLVGLIYSNSADKTLCFKIADYFSDEREMSRTCYQDLQAIVRKSVYNPEFMHEYGALAAVKILKMDKRVDSDSVLFEIAREAFCASSESLGTAIKLLSKIGCETSLNLLEKIASPIGEAITKSDLPHLEKKRDTYKFLTRVNAAVTITGLIMSPSLLDLVPAIVTFAFYSAYKGNALKIEYLRLARLPERMPPEEFQMRYAKEAIAALGDPSHGQRGRDKLLNLSSNQKLPETLRSLASHELIKSNISP